MPTMTGPTVNVFDDRFEQVIEQFENDWDVHRPNRIANVLEEHDSEDHLALISELVRIDVELRNKVCDPFSIDQYSDEFPELIDHPSLLYAIGFEDFRSRQRFGLPVDVERWKQIPGIQNETWYSSLLGDTENVSARNDPKQSTSEKEQRNRKNTPLDAKLEQSLDQIGFQVTELIGRGAFSHVYLATQQDLADRFVVLKIVDRSMTESRSIALLQHTNIVPIYSNHLVDQKTVICMPYAGCVTLSDLVPDGDKRRLSGEEMVATVRQRVRDSQISKKPQSASPAADDLSAMTPLDRISRLDSSDLITWVFKRIASGLMHAHARGILHGDIKPANVLIRNDGEPALLDFNLSHLIDSATAKHVGGTLPYMAPENLLGMVRHESTLSVPSDIYGFGVTMYQFATGRLPYTAPNSKSDADLTRAAEDRSNPVKWHSGDAVPPSLRTIIENCLAFDANDRYESAQQLHDDLDCESKNIPLRHGHDRIGTRLRKYAKRHPKLTSGGSVAFLIAMSMIPLIGLAAAWRQRSQQAGVVEQLNQFSERSTRVLASMIANPVRHTEQEIDAAMQPLADLGVLDPAAFDVSTLDDLPNEQGSKFRENMLRHINQVAIFEADRLITDSRSSPIKPSSLRRLDQLQVAGTRVLNGRDSRSHQYIEVEKSRIKGDRQAVKTKRDKASQTEMTSDTEVYLEAVRLLKKEQWGEAVDMLTSLADRGAIPPELRWTGLGRSQYSERNYEKAILSFTQSIERSPESSRLRLLRGLCYLQLSRGNPAEQDFSEAIRLDPTNWKALTNRGLIRLGRNQAPDAIEDFTTAMKFAPDPGHLLLLRSRAYRDLGDQEASQRDFDEVMQAKNLSAASLVSRARAREKSDPNAALSDLQAALAMDPNSTEIQLAMASLLTIELKRDAESIECLNEVIKKQPENKRALANRAVLRARLKQFDLSKADALAASAPPTTGRNLYQAACASALLPDQNSHIRALSLLSQAIRSGYEADNLAIDEDLDSVRKMPGFQAISRTYQLANLMKGKQSKAASKELSEPLLDKTADVVE
ncbi:serine/threonine-protein kinase [Rubripirellula reticaptiva]|uniref:non-specific serine/threonine protein kinase n=1 Tax=Rubripirellula reticaptiva TaxID=2528013 RepID=A0A5C6F3P5_9BACT|nr:serine/threonine-protein kinase [Rubripirellula reticaptiva]TWU55057.1 Serine/threonine-protein kinase PrkC [Rubripirellula reticaptiva]